MTPSSPQAGKSKKQQIYSGIFTMGRNDLGFVKIKEPEELFIEIAAHRRNHAMHRDQVIVEIVGTNSNGDKEGVVKEITSRAKQGFAGLLKFKEEKYYLQSDHARDDITLIIPEANLNGAKAGQKVFATVTDWGNNNNMIVTGTIVKVLGLPGSNDAEMDALALEKGFNADFPPNVTREAEAIKAKDNIAAELAYRRDMRDTDTFTIDPEDAKDFDDALSFKFLDNGNYEIGIHIADVSHYVTPGSALDNEAKDRATSVYLVDRTIPMLPEVLSNDLCSLRPNEDKLTYSAVFVITPGGEVVDSWFGRTVTHSDKRFSYEEAQAILDAGTGIFYKELDIINNLAKGLAEARFAKGALNLEQDEVKFLLDENGKPIDVRIKQRQDTNKLIEEFMLLANREVATFMAKKTKETVFVYRIHDKPEQDRVMNLRLFLERLGHKTNIRNGIIMPAELRRVLAEVQSDDEKDTIQTAIVRTMAKAIYSTENIGHFGLAFEYYTHFTSPIRRYPDVMVHRLMTKILKNEPFENGIIEQYKELSQHSSDRERDAQEAEWNSIKYKQVEYMSDKIGQEFTGVVTGVTKSGLFISEKKTKADGMARMANLPGDYYVYDAEKLLIYGQKRGRRFNIGDHVQIKIKDVDMEALTIDYVVLPDKK